jgi:hypothetical protein
MTISISRACYKISELIEAFDHSRLWSSSSVRVHDFGLATEATDKVKMRHRKGAKVGSWIESSANCRHGTV